MNYARLWSGTLALLVRTRSRQAALERRAGRVERLYAENEARIGALEQVAAERIAGLERSLAETTDTLTLAGRTLDLFAEVCRRHGYEERSGVTMLDWLDYVLDNAAAGWPSAN